MADSQVELRTVSERENAFEPPDQDSDPPVATAKAAVPLLWLALFDYVETQVRRVGVTDVLAAVTPVAQALARSAMLLQALPSDQRVLVDATRAMQRGLERARGADQLVLLPVTAFGGLRRNAARAYLAQLVGLCDLWEQLRKGKPWNHVRPAVEHLCPDVASVANRDPRVALYCLVGSLVEYQPSVADHVVQQGQEEQDTEPEALAVGEHGLLLGRFEGVWKLMSSGTSRELRGVWSAGAEGPAFCVGEHGTIGRIRKGRCTLMESSTDAHLRAVWGLGPKYVCAVGDSGTLVAYNGRVWQPWPVPGKAVLHAIGGAAPDNIWIAAQDSSLLRFDGRGWVRSTAPEATMFTQIVGDEEEVFAVGGARQGGVLYRLERGGWARDERLPRMDWIEGMWRGWGVTGVAPGNGPVLVDSGAGWASEELPMERLVRVASGAFPAAVGVVGRHHVIAARTETGWQLECAVPDLKINGIWVAGRPKPPRITTDGEQPSHS